MKMEITPIESYGGILFKREDKFKPFKFSNVNGSKLRQSIILVNKNIESARHGLITGTSIHSPQGVIVAATARHLNVPCNIIYGGTTLERIKNEKYPKEVVRIGGQVIIGSKCPRTSVLNSIANKFAENNGGYVIKYGFDMRNNIDCFIKSVAEQAVNIPDSVNDIIIVVGSSITLIGLLYGIAIYRKNINNIYAVGCAPNRWSKIEGYAKMIREETGVILNLGIVRYIDAFNQFKGFKYEETHDEHYYDITFHPRYEAKAWLYTRKVLKPKQDERTLFWINGKDIV